MRTGEHQYTNWRRGNSSWCTLSSFSHEKGCSVRRRDFRVLSWLLPSLKKQKGWMKVAIFLHFSISNKNLLQPPACLQDFLSCLTTSIFKLAQFLSVRNYHSYRYPRPSSTLLQALDYIYSCVVVLLLLYNFWWGVSPVPSQHMLHGSNWHKGTKSEMHLNPSCMSPGCRAHWILMFGWGFFTSFLLFLPLSLF